MKTFREFSRDSINRLVSKKFVDIFSANNKSDAIKKLEENFKVTVLGVGTFSVAFSELNSSQDYIVKIGEAWDPISRLYNGALRWAQICKERHSKFAGYPEVIDARRLKSGKDYIMIMEHLDYDEKKILNALKIDEIVHALPPKTFNNYRPLKGSAAFQTLIDCLEGKHKDLFFKYNPELKNVMTTAWSFNILRMKDIHNGNVAVDKNGKFMMVDPWA